MHIVDNRFDFRPAGTDKWYKSGFSMGTTSFRCPTWERHACYFMFSEPAAVCQNNQSRLKLHR
jgi:hypothetical protein